MNVKTLGLKWVLLSVFLTVYHSDAQSQALTSTTAPNTTSEFAVVSRGPNSRVWEKTVVETNFAGLLRTNTRSYTELRTGVCYENPSTGAYEDSVENIELTQSGAAATQGAHKVVWNANPNTPTGAVELTSPSGQKYSSTVYGLVYRDALTGSNVLIGQLQDSDGAVEGANTVIYTNAFSQINADIEYIYTMAGLEQNIILREQPPSPADFNLNPVTTWFGVMTVFFNPPMAETRTVTADGGSDDRLIRFPDMLMGLGTSFLDGISPERGSFPVTKHWLPQENGNAVLVEELPYTALTNLVGELPLHSSNAKPGGKVRRTASLQELFKHPSAKAETGNPAKMGRISVNNAHRLGLVVDYTLTGTLNSTSNFVFQCDTTYLINGQWSFYGSPGTLVFEGGTVVKYTNHGTIYNYGNSLGVFAGSNYRPSIFTSWQDNSVGTTITGSSGVPGVVPLTTYYIEEAGGGSSSNFVKNARFSYADYAYTDYSDPTYTFQDCQFVNCTTATFTPYGRKFYFRNDLCENCLDVFSSYGGPEIVDGENVTADSCTNIGLASSWWGAATYGGAFTNSILTDCGATSSFTFDHSEVVSSSSGIYQSVGAASYYLANGSPYRDSGTTNIGATLLADLQARTTYPPIVVQSSVFADNITLYPQAQRDTDVPDMGYHYEPLDYAINGAVSNAVITVLPGTSLATFGSSYGLWLYYNAVINSTGTATLPNYIVLYNTVQEQSNTNWETTTWVSSIYTPYSTDSSSASFTFTDWSILGGIDYHIESDANPCPISLVNCQFGGGTILDNGPAISSTNCLYDRVAVSMNQLSLENNFFNNLFHGGSLAYRYSNSIGDSWTFRDNLFDRTAITNLSGAGIGVCSNNAYVTNFGVIAPENNDVILTNSPPYQTGALGIYYYPTNQSNLIFKGSELASAVGLYHYTVTTNNVVEGTNVVSIGFHYVACGTNGLPLDTDGDGIPDYLEDSNGDGVFDTGDLSNWQVYNSPNGLTVPYGLVVFTPLR